MDGCTKQAILGGMCKKHYDEVNCVVKVRGGRKKPQHQQQEGGHQRGLSLFQDDDLMRTIIDNGNGTPTGSDALENDGLHGLSI